MAKTDYSETFACPVDYHEERTTRREVSRETFAYGCRRIMPITSEDESFTRRETDGAR